VVLGYAVSVGAVNATAGWALGLYMMGNCLLFYGLLRSGFNLRFADPSLTLPQIMVAITCVVGAYAILEESRGATLMLLVLVLVFGLFNLTASQARSAAFFALVAQGLTMLAMNTLEPGRYPVRQELIHFLFACTTLPTISLLAGQLSDLRSRLRARKDELAVAVERIQTLATRDELTGLFNRRHMVETLSLQKKFSDRGGRVFCIGILDIDHFKRVNDTHGHGAGDEVLRNFAHAVQRELRESDVIARWGGEEFLPMLTEVPVRQAGAHEGRGAEAVTGPLMLPGPPGSAHPLFGWPGRTAFRRGGGRHDRACRPGALPCQTRRAQPNRAGQLNTHHQSSSSDWGRFCPPSCMSSICWRSSCDCSLQ